MVKINGKDPSTVTYLDVEDLISGRRTDFPDMPETRWNHVMTTVTIDGNHHIVVSGGMDENNNTLSSVIYLDVNNPSAGWQTDFPDMPKGRNDHAISTATINGSDHIVVSGGKDGNGNTLSSIIYLDVENPTAGWQSLPDMPEERIIHAMSTVTINGNAHIVVSGGIDNNGNRLSTVIYLDVEDPTSGWQTDLS